MPRRIVGQCSTSTFRDVIHLVSLLDDGKEIYWDNLTKKQRVAIRVIIDFREHKIPLTVLFKLKEVLVWDMGNDKIALEYKLLDPSDAETRELLQSSI